MLGPNMTMEKDYRSVNVLANNFSFDAGFFEPFHQPNNHIRCVNMAFNHPPNKAGIRYAYSYDRRWSAYYNKSNHMLIIILHLLFTRNRHTQNYQCVKWLYKLYNITNLRSPLCLCVWVCKFVCMYICVRLCVCA